MQAYAELNYYWTESGSSTTPSAVSSSVGYPGRAGQQRRRRARRRPSGQPLLRHRRAAALPGRRRRPAHQRDQLEVRPRWWLGVKGSMYDWDIDSALLFSRQQGRQQAHRLPAARRHLRAARTRPPANVAPRPAAAPPMPRCRPAPCGASPKTPASIRRRMYAALSPTISNDAETRISQIDFKGTREFGQLPGGADGGGAWAPNSATSAPS